MIDEEEEVSLEIKLILLGEPGVGKTSIIGRYVHDTFDNNMPSSNSICYVGKIIKKNNIKIKLNIWDTIGQEKFRSISKIFLKDTKIVILVYSITSKESFNNLDYWLKLYQDQLEEGTILGVAANKIDLYLNQEVSEEEGQEYAEKNKAIFGLISAKINKNSIDKLIDNLLEAYLKKNKNILNNNINDNKTIKLSNRKIINNNNNSNGSCCSGGNSKNRKKKYDSIVKNLNGCLYSVFLGDKGVGKTSIINRINGRKINKEEPHTEKSIKFSIDYIHQDENINLLIYDVNIDKIKTKEFIEIVKKSRIFFLVYDVKNKQSYINLDYWIEVIKRCKDVPQKQNYALYIIGNKDDLSQTEEIEENEIINNNDNIKKYIEEGKEFSNSQNGIFKAVSALENRGIEKIIEEGIEHYLCLE